MGFNYTPKVVNFAPKESIMLLENIYSTGVSHDDHHLMIVMFIALAKGILKTFELRPIYTESDFALG